MLRKNLEAPGQTIQRQFSDLLTASRYKIYITFFFFLISILRFVFIFFFFFILFFFSFFTNRRFPNVTPRFTSNHEPTLLTIPPPQLPNTLFLLYFSLFLSLSLSLSLFRSQSFSFSQAHSFFSSFFLHSQINTLIRTHPTSES